MRTSFALLTLSAYVTASDHGSTYGGSGPYKSYAFEVESLVNHTFYQPIESALHSKLKLPVVVWGNGACMCTQRDWFCLKIYPLTLPVGAKFRAFLGEVTSWGALAIATGPIYVDPEDYEAPATDPANPASNQNPQALTDAIDWVHANAGKGDWKHIDASRIGVWGQSCGGLEAYTAGFHDDRVGHIGIFNSGQLNETASLEVAGAITKPVFYVLGGPTDVAYPNGERDYANLPRGTPAWKGNHQLGHSASFDVPNSGIPAIVGRHMLQWLLRGEKRAQRWFTGGGPGAIGIDDVEHKNLKSIKVTPI